MSAGLVLGSLPALAQSPAAEAAPPADNVVEAQRLYKLGEARYELFDFTAAIQYWTEAYALVPAGDPDTHRVRTVLVRNLSVAHLKAFEVDEDQVHLRTGKMLLGRYIKELETYYADEGDAAGELKEAQDQLAEIEAKLAKIEKEKEDIKAAEAAQAERDANGGNNGGGNNQVRDPVDPGPQVDEEAMQKGKTLVVAGGIILGLGVGAGAGLGIGGAAMGNKATSDVPEVDVELRPDVLERGRTGNILAYTGLAVGGVGLITGVVLIALGAKKKQHARQMSFVPNLSPRNAGATFSLEF